MDRSIPIRGRPANGSAASTSSSGMADPDKALYFWRPNQTDGFLSMFAPSPFCDPKYKHIVYPTAEHYLQYHRAVLFRDVAAAHEILSRGSPHDAQRLGRAAQGNSAEAKATWHRERDRIARAANECKFTQPVGPFNFPPWFLINAKQMAAMKEPKAALLATGDRQLLLAAPMDKHWGIGYWEKRAWARREKWGDNILGKILMDIRKQIRTEEATRLAEEQRERERTRAPRENLQDRVLRVLIEAAIARGGASRDVGLAAQTELDRGQGQDRTRL
ncbi:hypothetical protein F4677DRAFT_446338 [Hypoxylon crocopeplum]|nr:hypothetical protein F4677DRAFT_446338 [Hypoxylon crocopeplum]